MPRRRVTLPKDDAEWQILLDKLGFNADDRTAVILGGSLVEARLEELVVSWLRPGAPLDFLSAFWAKKQAAFALGYIDEEEDVQLEAIASIRNVFAHHLLDATFQHPKVRENLEKLRAIKRVNAQDPPRTVFRNAVVHFAMELNHRKRDPVTRAAFSREAEERVNAQWRDAIRKHREQQQHEDG